MGKTMSRESEYTASGLRAHLFDSGWVNLLSETPVALLVKADWISKGCKFGAHGLPKAQGSMDRTRRVCELGCGGNL